jgi:hypothetical protein
MSTRLG